MGQPEEPATDLPWIRGFQLGEWTVRQAEGTLSSATASVRLEPRVMDVLVFLAAQEGKVVSKQELLAAVWGGALVEEGALPQAIHSLRKALGDDARQPRFVQTLPKRGYRLLVPAQPAETPGGTIPIEPSRSAAERRQITAMSCGLAAAGGPAGDPEDLLERFPALHRLLAEVVARFEGILGPRRGCGWVAWFGYPQAHEDDAHRAVRAALEIATRASQLAPRPGARTLRIGIHTGPVVLTGGSDALDDVSVTEAPEVASLVQGLAAAGEVLVSPATRRLIAGFFECEELEPVSLSPSMPPLRAWRILADRGAQNRIEAGGTMTPLVGREQELGLLLERWTLAREGAGQVVLLAGEAGLGKSRLVWELRRRVTGEDTEWLEAHGSPYHRDSAFHPIRELLHRWLAAEPNDSPPADPLVRLEQRVARLVPDLPQAVPLLASLLSLPAGEPHVPPPASPEAQRRQTIEAIVALLLAAAERRPLLLVVEDLHWLDPSSLELLGLLVEQAAAVPLLLLLTFRPEHQPPWGQRSDLTRLTLGPLSRAQAGIMVALTADRSLPTAVREQIAARTDGVPLFIEELTRMILEAGAPSGLESASERPSSEIPDTLEGWLRARLDRLGPAREIAQLAAVLGREIPAGLLKAVSPWSEEHLEHGLERLVDAEILFRRGRPPHQRYLFKHALIQDAAYASLLRADRRRHHRRITEALERSFPELAADQPEVLARHYAEAGLPDRAVPLWQRAGEKAVQGSAYLEAGGHFQRALALLGELPATADRIQQEISLQLNLGMALAATRTFSTPEVQRAFQRAWELCGEVGQTPQVFTTLRGLVTHRLISGDTVSALEIGERLHELAREEPSLLRVSHQGLGFILLCRGELVRARAHLEDAISRFGSASSGVDLSLPGTGNLLLEGTANLAWTLWFLGYPDEALHQSRKALAQAREQPALFARCFVEYFAAELHAYRREPEEVRTQIDELASLAAEQGYSHFISVAVFLRAWAESLLGKDPSAIERMRKGIDGRLAQGARGGIPNHLGLLAERCLAADRIPQGLAAVEEALEISNSGEQRIFDAELWRLKGELLLHGGAPDAAAEEQFGRSLEVARQQYAKSLELRAAMSLARLWAAQGKRNEARELLSGVYGWFTEGFATRDLRDARKLLGELSGGR